MSARLVAVRGDITRQDADVVANAANRALVRGGGVCGAIFAAAGPQLDRACVPLGGCATGDAKLTPGFGLPARYIAHTVGPVWHGGTAGEADLLASCYRRVLDLAASVAARTVAFPAISTGIFGYPLGEAAPIAVGTVRKQLAHEPTTIEEVRFVCFDADTFAAYQEALGEEQTPSGTG